MNLQKVTVTGWAEQKKVLKTVRKTGRRAELWQLPYNPQEFQNHYQQPLHHCNGPVMSHYAPQPSSSYNYYKHGYDSLDRSYYHNPGHSNIFGYQTGAAFSDENPHGCSVMWYTHTSCLYKLYIKICACNLFICSSLLLKENKKV